MLADFVTQQADAVVMEVSSHGLDQGRVNGVEFDIAVLTNLSRDHLDYHQTMTAYAEAKQKLFDLVGLKVAVLNVDDAFGQKIASTLIKQAKPIFSYGLQYGDVRGSQLQLHDAGLSMQVSTPAGDALLAAPVLGRFNAYNLLAVLATLLALEVSLSDAVVAISQIKPVAGRMQQFGGGSSPLVVVDYAHTPDALEKVLSTLREQLQTGAKLLCVFGCGGDRDAGKRPLMGAIAHSLADTVIVTSDNPRSEDAKAIIQAIIADNAEVYLVEEDRASAIKLAIKLANKGDIVLVAGKGHENYQEILGVKHLFDDALIAQAALNLLEVSKSDMKVSL
jgi:UDP-N-acetylmuramyl-tripeptide synthetase